MNLIEKKLTNHSKRIKLTENFVNENLILKKNVCDEDDLASSSSSTTYTTPNEEQIIDTKVLSNRVNKFLNDHSITQTLFNREVAAMIQLRFHLFLKNPLDWPQYQEKTRKRLTKINEFLNDEQQIETFLAKHSNTTSSVTNFIDTKHLARRLSKFLLDNNVTQVCFNREIANMNPICFHVFLKRPSDWAQYRESTRKKIEGINEFLRDSERVAKFLDKVKKKSFKRAGARGKSRADISKLNDNQVNQLNGVYKSNQYPTQEFIEYLSNCTDLTVNQISSWFTTMRGSSGGVIINPNCDLKLELVDDDDDDEQKNE